MDDLNTYYTINDLYNEYYIIKYGITLSFLILQLFYCLGHFKTVSFTSSVLD